MPLFKWDDELSVGVNELDEQHKMFIDMMNALADSMKAGETKIMLGVLIDKLVDYMADHCRTEEMLMLKSKYPEYALHIEEHAGIMARVLGFREKLYKDSTGLSVELLSFLTALFEKHTKNSDKKFGEFLKRNMS